MDTYLERHPARTPRDGDPDVAALPLLLVHGLGGDRHSWRPVIDGLRAEHDVLVVELPGFGATPPLPAAVEPSPAALAAAVLRALDEAGVERVHVVGHSLGGWVALELADLAPRRVASVVGLTPAGFWSRPLEDRDGRAVRVGRRLAPLLPLILAPRRVRDGLLVGALGGPGGFSYGDGLAIVRGYVMAGDYARVNAAMRRRVFDYTARLAPMAARIPIAVAWADEDHMVSAPRIPLPSAVLQHVLEGAGHLPMYDRPDQVVELLLTTTRPVRERAEAR